MFIRNAVLTLMTGVVGKNLIVFEIENTVQRVY